MDIVALIRIAGDLVAPFFDVAFAVVAFASAIAAMTKTPRDDEFVGKAYKVLEVLALNFGHAKELPPNRAGGRFVAR